MNKEKDEILNKLTLIYKKYNPYSKPNKDSQLCLLWSVDNPPDVLENTEQLDDLENAFNIYIDEDNAFQMYDMNLLEVSEYIQKLIKVQNEDSNS